MACAKLFVSERFRDFFGGGKVDNRNPALWRIGFEVRRLLALPSFSALSSRSAFPHDGRDVVGEAWLRFRGEGLGVKLLASSFGSTTNVFPKRPVRKIR